ncbi:MAG: DUF2891 family protein [Myxococcota bacterium]
MISISNNKVCHHRRAIVTALLPSMLGMVSLAACGTSYSRNGSEDVRENGSECLDEELDLRVNQGAWNGSSYAFGHNSIPTIRTTGEPADLDHERWAMLHDGKGYLQYFMNEAGDKVHRFEWDGESYAYQDESVPVVGFPPKTDKSSFAMLHDGELARLYFLNEAKNQLIQGAFDPNQNAFVYGYQSGDFPIMDIPEDADFTGWAMLHSGDDYHLYSYAGDQNAIYHYTYIADDKGFRLSATPKQDITGFPGDSSRRDFAMLHDGGASRLYLGDHERTCQGDDGGESDSESGGESDSDGNSPGGCMHDDELLGRMAVTIEEGLDRTSPHWGASGPTGIFGGNYDYHSAVHGQWARLSMARITGDTAREEAALDDLSEENLVEERAFLVDNPTFERPYGRAWMLVLLSEVAAAPDRNTEVLRQMREDSEQELLDWLEHNTSKASNDGSIGQHGSWLFALLMLQMSDPVHPESTPRIDALYEDVVDGHRADWRERSSRSGDFLHIPSIIDTLDLLRGQPAQRTVENMPPSRIDSLGAGHIVGEEMTRLWPLAILAREDAAACDLLGARIQEWLESPQHWESNFASNSHWTPQFLWMGIQLRG